MSVITVTSFLGENRAAHPSLLPDGVGTVSNNHRPGRGDLRPWGAASTVATVPAGSSTIYRMGRDTASDTNYWLAWANTVHVVRGFNADDPSERTYYTGDSYPKWTDTAKALTSAPYPTAYRAMGIPAPATAPSVSATTASIAATALVSGKSYVITAVGTTDFTLVGAPNNSVGSTFTATGAGTGTGTVRTNNPLETRYYVYTYVSDDGAESAPSPPSSAVSCRTDDQATVSGFASAPSGSYGINRIRVYRTQTGTTSTDYFFLRELGTTSTIAATSMTRGVVYTIVTVGTTNYTLYGASNNNVGTSFTATAAGTGTGTVSTTTLSLAATTDDLRTLGEVLPSVTWIPAPGVPQGGLLNYTEPPLTNLIGLWNGMMAGITGRSVRLCEPYEPYAWPITYEILPPEVTPVALGKVGQMLVILTNGRPIIATGSSPDSMDEQPLPFLQACVSAKSVVSCDIGVFYAGTDGLCVVNASGPSVVTSGILTRDDWQALNPSTIVGTYWEGRYIGFYTVSGTTKGFVYQPENPNGMYFTTLSAVGGYFDSFQDTCYLLDSSGNIGKWNAGSALTVQFKSKTYRFPRKVPGFSVGQVIADAYPVTFNLYADGALKFTTSVTSSAPFRITSGYWALQFNLEVQTTNAVQAVSVAHTMDEISKV